MHYTADFCMRHYAGFSQIGSHMLNAQYVSSPDFSLPKCGNDRFAKVSPCQNIILYSIYDEYNLTDSNFITLSTNGCKMVFMPYLLINHDSTTASSSIHFNFDRSAGLMFLRVK